MDYIRKIQELATTIMQNSSNNCNIQQLFQQLVNTSTQFNIQQQTIGYSKLKLFFAKANNLMFQILLHSSQISNFDQQQNIQLLNQQFKLLNTYLKSQHDTYTNSDANQQPQYVIKTLISEILDKFVIKYNLETISQQFNNNVVQQQIIDEQLQKIQQDTLNQAEINSIHRSNNLEQKIMSVIKSLQSQVNEQQQDIKLVLNNIKQELTNGVESQLQVNTEIINTQYQQLQQSFNQQLIDQQLHINENNQLFQQQNNQQLLQITQEVQKIKQTQKQQQQQLQLQNQEKQTNSHNYDEIIHQMRQQITELQNSINETNNNAHTLKLSQLTEEMVNKQIQNQLITNKAQIDNKILQLQKQFDLSIVNNTDSIQKYWKEQEQLFSAQINDQIQSNQQINEEISVIKTRFDQIQQTVNKFLNNQSNSEMQHGQQSLEEMKRQIAQLQVEMQENLRQQTNTELLPQIQKMQQKLAEIDKKTSDTVAANKNLQQTQLDRLQEQINDLTGKFENYNVLALKNDQQTAIKEQIQKITDNLNDQTNQITQIKSEQSKLNAIMREMQSEITNNKQLVDNNQQKTKQTIEQLISDNVRKLQEQLNQHDLRNENQFQAFQRQIDQQQKELNEFNTNLTHQNKNFEIQFNDANNRANDKFNEFSDVVNSQMSEIRINRQNIVNQNQQLDFNKQTIHQIGEKLTQNNAIIVEQQNQLLQTKKDIAQQNQQIKDQEIRFSELLNQQQEQFKVEIGIIQQKLNNTNNNLLNSENSELDNQNLQQQGDNTSIDTIMGNITQMQSNYDDLMQQLSNFVNGQANTNLETTQQINEGLAQNKLLSEAQQCLEQRIQNQNQEIEKLIAQIAEISDQTTQIQSQSNYNVESLQKCVQSTQYNQENEITAINQKLHQLTESIEQKPDSNANQLTKKLYKRMNTLTNKLKILKQSQLKQQNSNTGKIYQLEQQRNDIDQLKSKIEEISQQKIIINNNDDQQLTLLKQQLDLKLDGLDKLIHDTRLMFTDFEEALHDAVTHQQFTPVKQGINTMTDQIKQLQQQLTNIQVHQNLENSDDCFQQISSKTTSSVQAEIANQIESFEESIKEQIQSAIVIPIKNKIMQIEAQLKDLTQNSGNSAITQDLEVKYNLIRVELDDIKHQLQRKVNFAVEQDNHDKLLLSNQNTIENRSIESNPSTNSIRIKKKRRTQTSQQLDQMLQDSDEEEIVDEVQRKRIRKKVSKVSK